MIYKTAAVFTGVLIAVMVSLNGVLAGYTSNMFSVLIIHMAGILTVGAIVLFKREKAANGGKMPIYIFSAGAVGVLLTYLNNICIGALGVSLTLALGLAGQSVLSCVIDHFGLFGVKRNSFNYKKLIGFALSFLGVLIMVLC